MKHLYFPGCTLKTRAKNFEQSAIESAKILDIDLVELENWNCCGTVFSLTNDDLIHHIASVRNLIKGQNMLKEGKVEDNRIITLCSMCFNTLKNVNQKIKNDLKSLHTINDFMYLEENYEGNMEVVHFFEILNTEDNLKKIKENVKIPLNNLKISPYYGCTLLRPKDVAIDDPEDPTIMENFLLALSANVVDNPKKKLCCGAYQTVHDVKLTTKLIVDIITNAKKSGADAIITSCPLCAYNLDFRQREAQEMYTEFEGIPVLYFTQVMGLAFGIGEDKLGFDMHYKDPRPLLRERGIIN